MVPSDKPYFEYFNPSWVIFKQANCKTTKISNMLSILVLAEYGSPFFSDQTLLTIARAEHLKARNPISFVLVVQRLPKFPLPMYKFWLKSKSWMKNVNPHSYDILVMAGWLLHFSFLKLFTKVYWTNKRFALNLMP